VSNEYFLAVVRMQLSSMPDGGGAVALMISNSIAAAADLIEIHGRPTQAFWFLDM